MKKKKESNKYVHAHLLKEMNRVRDQLDPGVFELICKALNDKYHGWAASCPCCGTTELLCGYGGPGCISEREVGNGL